VHLGICDCCHHWISKNLGVFFSNRWFLAWFLHVSYLLGNSQEIQVGILGHQLNTMGFDDLPRHRSDDQTKVPQHSPCHQGMNGEEWKPVTIRLLAAWKPSPEKKHMLRSGDSFQAVSYIARLQKRDCLPHPSTNFTPQRLNKPTPSRKKHPHRFSNLHVQSCSSCSSNKKKHHSTSASL
jgi:hypothetical protein